MNTVLIKQCFGFPAKLDYGEDSVDQSVFCVPCKAGLQ